MHEELDRDRIKERAVRGVASLFARQLSMRIIGFAGMLVLARVLTPEIFGVFAIAQFVVFFFEQLSSLGLSAALLRKKGAISEIELRTVFTAQQIAVSLSVLVILLAAPLIVRHYGLAASYTALIRVMAVGLFLASLKTIPTVILERGLRHDRVAVSEVCEYLVYQLMAIGFAVMGLGIWALVAGILARGVTGVIMVYFMARWRPGLAFDREVLRETLRFGVPVQLSQLFGLALNATIPVLVGSISGAAAVGFANFARNLADTAIFQPIIIMGRVQLPVFSRLQDDRDKLGTAIERNLHAGSLLTFLLAALIFSQATPFIELLAGAKWRPAVPILQALVPAYLAYAISQPLMQALKALGDSKTPLYAIALQAFVQTAVFLALAPSLGLAGFGCGVAAGTTCVLAVGIRRIRRHTKVKVWQSVRAPLVCAVIAGAVGWVASHAMAGIAGLLLGGSFCLLTYIAFAVLLDRHRLGQQIAAVLNSMARKPAAAPRGRLQWVRR